VTRASFSERVSGFIARPRITKPVTARVLSIQKLQAAS